MNRNLFTTAICTLAGAMIASADVPSFINYQGRLTDSGGAPVTGSKNFAISIYDAATGGNLLYSETIGAVTLDSNGVYNFQFGGAGTSNTQVTETIGTTAGSTLTYTKTLSNTPVVANSITVTDGTNSWSQSVGNPGAVATATATTISGFVIGATITSAGSGYTSAPAVTITGNGSGAAATATISGGTVTGITITSAGSGYTGGATITIAPPIIPFRVDYSGGAITATYSTAPAAGQAITATYRYGTSGITDALGSGSQQWMAVSVDGVAQGTRQRILAVPFALKSSTASFAQNAVDQEGRQQMADMFTSMTANRVFTLTKAVVTSRNYADEFVQASARSVFSSPSTYLTFQLAPAPSASKLCKFFTITASEYFPLRWYEIEYTDGEVVRYNTQSNVSIQINNPRPSKQVAYLRGYTSNNNFSSSITAAIYTTEMAVSNFSIQDCPSVTRGAVVVYSSNSQELCDVSIDLVLQNGRTIKTKSGLFENLGSPIAQITVTGSATTANASFSTIKLFY